MSDPKSFKSSFLPLFKRAVGALLHPTATGNGRCSKTTTGIVAVPAVVSNGGRDSLSSKKKS
jgi:hypothetical protein